jgi:hypothetical protein
MPLTDVEKTSIRHHLGYMQVAAAYTFVLGVPAGVETNFLIEGAMDRVLESALPLVRKLLFRLDCTEEQDFTNQANHAVDRIGDIVINKDEMKELAKGYEHWQGALCNVLGTMVNPYSKRPRDNRGGGVNVPVIS